MYNPTWVIFARLPIPGKCKTRLAKHLGNERAAAVYRTLLETTLRAFQDRTPVLCTTDGTEREWQQFAEQHGIAIDFTQQLQHGETLGDKMYYSMLQNQQPNCAIGIVGSDLPSISQHIVDLAEQKLHTHDLVIGPSFDGGFYLLATNKPVEHITSLFDGDNYSHDKVLDNLIRNAKALDLTYHLLPVERDCDTIEDYEATLGR